MLQNLINWEEHISWMMTIDMINWLCNSLEELCHSTVLSRVSKQVRVHFKVIACHRPVSADMCHNSVRFVIVSCHLSSSPVMFQVSSGNSHRSMSFVIVPCDLSSFHVIDPCWHRFHVSCYWLVSERTYLDAKSSIILSLPNFLNRKETT